MSEDHADPGFDRLRDFLNPSAQTADCAQTMALLSVYVEAVVSGADVERLHPGVAAHLRTCDPCIEDFDGLLALVRAERPHHD